MDFNIFLRRYKFLLFRLKDAAKRSESNPRDEVSWDSDGIKNFARKAIHFLIDLSSVIIYRKTVEFQTPPSSSNQYSLIPKLSIPFPNSCTDSPQDVSYNTVCPQ